MSVRMKENGAPFEYGTLVVEPIVVTTTYSMSRVTISGENRPNKNRISNADYTCIDGRGYMRIDGRVIPMSKGVTVEIPPNVPFQDWSLPGEEMVLISEYSPPFDRKQVEILE